MEPLRAEATIDVTAFSLCIIGAIELWNDMRYLSDIKNLLGSVSHHKVHCYAQIFPLGAWGSAAASYHSFCNTVSSLSFEVRDRP